MTTSRNKTNYTFPIPTREAFHHEYAGEILPSDFNTNYPNKYRLQAQFSASAFNYQCRQHGERVGDSLF